MIRLIFKATVIAGIILSASPIAAQTDWKKIGQLTTHSAKQIKGSTWSIGGETLDRDYTDFHSYKKYLGPLGAKHIRLQGGWAKTEKVKGVYDFAWLDVVVKDVLSQGVSPWIELSYGNPVYAGGGEAKLSGALPSSQEALSAWDNWVTAMVTRYKNQVTEWEIWNEPDGDSKRVSPGEYAVFYLRTATLVKQLQPNARLMAFGLAYPARTEFTETLLRLLKEVNKSGLVDVVTFHGYSPNPDKSYPAIERLKELVDKYNPKVLLMQGENGAPSTPKQITIGAMNDHDWSELTQAKWDVRRMLADHGRGISTNLFTISDIHYSTGDNLVGVNTKGLLKTNPDKTIDRPKLAYKAAQHVFSLFDNTLEPLTENKPEVAGDGVAVFGYSHEKSERSLITLWTNEAKPEDAYEPKPVTVTINRRFKHPVFIDMVSGMIYELPRTLWELRGRQSIFKSIPVPDYPVVLAERSIVLKRN